MSKLEEDKSKVLSYFWDLQFFEETHTYKVNDEIYPSVSSIMGRFKNPFDTNKVAFFVAKGRGITTEQVLQEWEENKNKACELGTKTHAFGENYCSSSMPTSGFEEAIVKFYNDLPEYIVPVFRELQMYSKKYKFAGTADLILYNKNTQKYIIVDYKTNKELFKNYKNQKLLPPFDNLLDNNFNKYQIQLSAYQYLLEQTEIEVENRRIVWLKEDGSYQLLDTENLVDKIISIL